MPLIPILDLEGKVQVNDKTRLDASKSFATKGTTAITALTIKPGESASAISVFSATVADRYLDWAFTSASTDIDATNNKIYIEVSNTVYTGTITSGTYTFSALASEIQTQLNTLTALVFTVSLDENDKLTVAADGKFKILASKPLANLWKQVGFEADSSASMSVLGNRIEYGVKKITVSVDITPTAPETKSFYQKVFTVEGDGLFSVDQDIIQQEPEIMKWVVKGRASFLDMHRRSQELILDWLYQNNYTDINGNRLKKYALIDKQSVRLWSAFQALYLIFMGLQNANDDVFKEKAQYYEKLMLNARNQALLEIDIDGDGDGDEKFKPSSWSGSVIRR